MDVETIFFRDRKEIGGEYLPVCDDHEIIGSIGCNILEKLSISPNFCRLKYGYIMGECESFYFVWRDNLMSSNRLIFSSYHENNLHIGGGYKVRENLRREVWGAKESDAEHRQ